MLELNRVCHRYAEPLVVDHVSLTVGKGEIAGILGPSGCGKSTLLRCIAGFERLDGGRIEINGELVSSSTDHVPAEARRIGMVFQDYALLPHLSALENVVFGLHEKPAAAALKVAGEMLERVSLAEFADRYPHELSGGQQQRVAIARALAPGPSLLLMDEPFSNLDSTMRSGLGREMKSVLHSLGTTVLIATHDHNDAFALAQFIGVMRAGELLQWDSAYNIYHQPVNQFVAEFAGKGVWLPGKVVAGNAVEIEVGIARGTMTTNYPVGTAVDLFLRPDDVVHDDSSSVLAEVSDRRFRGSEFLYELRTSGGVAILSTVPSHHDHAIGERIGIRLDTDHLVVFPRESNRTD